MDNTAPGGVHGLLSQFDSLHARVKSLQDHVGSPEKSPPKGVSPTSTASSASDNGFRTVEEPPSSSPTHRAERRIGSPPAAANGNGLLEYKVQVLEKEKSALERELKEARAVADLVKQFEAKMEEDREERKILVEKIEDLAKTTQRFQTQQQLKETAAPTIMDHDTLNAIPAICMRLEKRIDEFGENLERSTSALRVSMEREAQRREAQRRVSKGGTPPQETKRKPEGATSEESLDGVSSKGLDWAEVFHAEQLELTITPGKDAPEEEQEEQLITTRCGCMKTTKKEEVKGWFRIQCKHSSSSWAVVRAASEFVFLHLHLKEQAMLRKIDMEVHHFPKRHFIAATTEKQKKVLCKSLERYLKQLACMPGVASHQLFLQFLQISAATLQKGFEPCRHEGAVTRSTGSAVTHGGCCGCSLSLFNCWGGNKHHQRWFVLKDSCLFYMHSPLFFQPMGVMLFDRTSKLSPDPEQFLQRRFQRLHKIEFSNGGRNLMLHFKSSNQARRWLASIAKAMQSSPYCRMDNKYEAFAPPRPNCKMQWYLNGCAYFHAVADAIDEARRVVYIAGWYLSPHIYLRRPSRENEHWRLDKLLQRKAAQGVKIYVLLFRELEVCMEANNSHFAKQVLRGLHSNIFVLRSPNDIAITYHSHHEKLVITDAGAGCAFVGGIDLAFGRWDTSAYPLSDAGEVLLWPGKDYCNEAFCVTKGTDLPFLDHMDRGSEPRLPWHDFAVKVCGDAAFDVARHFISRWNKRTHNETDGQHSQLIPEVPWTAEDLFEADEDPKHKGYRKGSLVEGRVSDLKSMSSDTHSMPRDRAERMSLRGRMLSRDGRDSLTDRQLRKMLAVGGESRKNLMMAMSVSDSRRHLFSTKSESRRHLVAPPQTVDATNRDHSPSNLSPSGSNPPLSSQRTPVHSQQAMVSGAAMGRDSTEIELDEGPTPGTKGPSNWDVEIQIDDEQGIRGGRDRTKSVEFGQGLAATAKERTSGSPESGGSERGSQHASVLRRASQGTSPTYAVQPPRSRSPDRQSTSRSPRTSLRGSPAGALGPVGGWIPDKVLSIGRVDGAPALLDHISEESERSRSHMSESLLDASSSKPPANHRLTPFHSRSWSEDNMASFPFASLARSPSGDIGTGRGVFARAPSSGGSASETMSNATLLRRAMMQGSQRSLMSALPHFGSSFRRRTSSAAFRELSHLKMAVLSDTGVEEDCTCQILRSIDKWSGDLVKENSIEEAYIRLIRGAKHYIHIENQFFVSKCEGSDEVENRVAQAIKDRIIQEINDEKRNKVESQFRVVVLMPLMPGLPGSPQINASKRMLLHLQYQTICRNNGLSLIEKLREVTDTPEKYIGFYGLRQWGRMPDGLVRQEQIYIHGKLMIVDDRHILCGSPNINDRSLLGKNDSELALVMTESEHKVPSKMFGRSWVAFRAARDMRKRLYQMHLGPRAENLEMDDPCSPDMLKAWAQIAKDNSETYRNEFRCFPDDLVLNWDTFEKWEEEQETLLEEQLADSGDRVEATMQSVSGHLVEFPLRFLEQEDLCPTWTEKEYHVDRRVFT